MAGEKKRNKPDTSPPLFSAPASWSKKSMPGFSMHHRRWLDSSFFISFPVLPFLLMVRARGSRKKRYRKRRQHRNNTVLVLMEQIA
jgi:hypothetical protein